MAKVNYTNRSNLQSVARKTVKAGQVFAVIIENKPGKKRYAAIGHNGRWLSMNLENGELSSTSKGDKKVLPVGKYDFSFNLNNMDAATRLPKVTKTVKRSEVKSGEIFVVKGQESQYVHLGTLNRDGKGTRFCSMRVGSGENDYATTDNGNSNVDVIGTAELNVESVQ